MAFFDIKNVTLKGISACVPQKVELVKDIYHWDGVDAFIETTGIKKHLVAASDITTSDLSCC